MANEVLCEIEGSIAIVTLNIPELRNPVSEDAMVDNLLETMEQLNDNESIRVAIITGQGSAFSSGGNLKKMGRFGGINDELPARTRRNYKKGIQRLPIAFEALDIPVIAAINGPAIGAGLDVTCMCDIRIASEQARFAESFVKVGLVPGDGGAWLLPRVVGFAKACEMALTGDAIGAEEALAFGLVSKVVPAEHLMAEAKVMAERIAVNPPQAVRMTKRLLREGQTMNLEPLLELSAAMQAVAHATQDHNEAVDSFLERRPPDFTGN